MKVTRTKKQKPQKPRKPVQAPKVNNPGIASITDKLNIPGVFTYMDANRNSGAIEMIRHQVTQAISNYGVDLQYFRKYNTFFKEGDENKSNLVYGEDTTAEFYASGMIRAFVSVENMAWNFTQIGLDNTEQINIYVSIDNFEQAMQDEIAKTSTSSMTCDVFGDTITNEVTGLIRCQEFEAKVYGTFTDDDLTVSNATVSIIDKSVTDAFYKSLKYQKNKSTITGTMSGKLVHDEEKPFVVSGTLSGELTFKNSLNKEDSETWKRLAPQVGDYFKFKPGTGIEEEWEITNVYDRNLTKGAGLSQLLGKYIYQMNAVKRIDSYEENSEELNGILGDVTTDGNYAEQYKSNTVGENKHNKKLETLRWKCL